MLSHYRYLIALLGFAVHFSIFITRMNLYIAIIDMADLPQFNWTERDQSLMMSSYFYGYTVLMAFSGSLVAWIGAKRLVVGGTVLAGLATCIFPWVVKYSFTVGFILRLLTGVLHAPIMAAEQEILIPWSPHNEYSRLYFVQVSGALIGNFACFAIGGSFIDHFGWEKLFIYGGLFSSVTGLVYYFLVEERPENCRWATHVETAFIVENRLNFNPKSPKSKIPYRALLTSIPMWSVNSSFFTFSLIHAFFTNIFSKYLMDNFSLTVAMIGLLTSLPTLGEFFAYLVSAFVADHYITKGMSTTTVRKVISTIAQFVPGAICLLMTQTTNLPVIIFMSTLVLRYVVKTNFCDTKW